MDLTYSATSLALQERLTAFMNDFVLPAETVAAEQLAAMPDLWGAPPIMADLKREAKRAGLWNLVRHDDAGTVLSHLDYAPLAELTGWSPLLAPEATNCSPPDTGNMELLRRFGTEEQQREWLQPLLAGDIRSCFSMTEPDVASSDANNVCLEIVEDGNDWVLTGRKWWSTGALREDCKVALVMGVTDADASTGNRHSIVLVPLATPGLTVLRSTSVLGFTDRYEGGHGELLFDHVRVPKRNLLGGRGRGFAVAQARLGPGRMHHCMRLIGMGERALALAVHRTKNRVAFGLPLSEQGVVQAAIADARVALDSARLLVLRAARRMDVDGSKAARHDIAAAKIAVPRTVKEIVDDVIQMFGGAGLSQDTILATLYAQARFLQIADGPDQVHRRSVAKYEYSTAPVLAGARW